MGKCKVCHHNCEISEGSTGFCMSRSCRDGKIIADNYGYISSMALDPIEKKPLKRFHIGSKILSVGSYGCNLRCPFCQNNEISYGGKKEYMRRLCQYISPEELVSIAENCRSDGNIGIAFTYNEPLISYEYVRDTCLFAARKDLKTVLVSNGSASKYVCEQLNLDAMNIDLKGFTDDYYRNFLKGDRQEVMAFIEMSSAKCHMEVTCLIIPGYNDSDDEISELSSWLASLNKGKGSEEIVLHISRFFPQFNLTDIPATPVDTVYHLAEVARKNLRYVYTGNC